MPPLKKNKFKPEKVAPLSRFGASHIIISGLAIPTTIEIAAAAIRAHGLSLVSIGFVAAAAATTFRFATSLDNYVVSKHALHARSSFSDFIYKIFRKSPLRIYTVNHLGRHVEQLLMLADEKAAYHSEYRAPKQKKDKVTDADSLEQSSEFSVKHTADHLAEISDPRRHLEHVMIATLAVFAGFQLLGELSGHGHFSPFQKLQRIGGYALDLAYSIGHIDAYIQRRAAESPPRPFFILANKWAKRIPITRLGGNLYIWWDYKNIQTLEAGRQLWDWRAEMAVAQKLPSFIGKHWIERLNRTKMKITPQVIDRLTELNALERLENLKAVARGNQPDPLLEKINIRAAYADLVADTDLKAVKVGEQYRIYQAQVANRNAVNLERANAKRFMEPSFTEKGFSPPPLSAYRPLMGEKRIFPERKNG